MLIPVLVLGHGDYYAIKPLSIKVSIHTLYNARPCALVYIPIQTSIVKAMMAHQVLCSELGIPRNLNGHGTSNFIMRATEDWTNEREEAGTVRSGGPISISCRPPRSEIHFMPREGRSIIWLTGTDTVFFCESSEYPSRTFVQWMSYYGDGSRNEGGPDHRLDSELLKNRLMPCLPPHNGRSYASPLPGLKLVRKG